MGRDIGRRGRDREIDTTEDRASQPDAGTATRRASGDSGDGGRERGSGEDKPENRGVCEEGGKGGDGDFETSDCKTGDARGENHKAGDFKAMTLRP